MTGPPAARIDEVGISAMRFSQGPAHEVRPLRVQNQMHVVGHKAVAHTSTLDLRDLLRKHIAINLVIPILEENDLPAIATLGHMVRETRDDHAGRARHAGKTITNSGK